MVVADMFLGPGWAEGISWIRGFLGLTWIGGPSLISRGLHHFYQQSFLQASFPQERAALMTLSYGALSAKQNNMDGWYV